MDGQILIVTHCEKKVTTFKAPAGHEAGPEHPEEQCAQQREGVGGLRGYHQPGVSQVDRRVKRPAHTQTWDNIVKKVYFCFKDFVEGPNIAANM